MFFSYKFIQITLHIHIDSSMYTYWDLVPTLLNGTVQNMVIIVRTVYNFKCTSLQWTCRYRYSSSRHKKHDIDIFVDTINMI